MVDLCCKLDTILLSGEAIASLKLLEIIVTNSETKTTRARKSACGMVRNLLETSPGMTDKEIFDAMTEAFPGKTYTVALVTRYRREMTEIQNAEEISSTDTVKDARAATITRLANELMEAAD